jgi:NADPH:quinone reductase-like Zn-dependent oxidoreductase
VRCYEIQKTFDLDALTLVERADPEPGPGQVLIRVKAASLNYRDLLMVQGAYPKQTLPLVPLSDGAGEVLACGPGVTRAKAGDRVAGIFTILGGPLDGMLTEQIVLHEDGVAPVPRHLTDEEAATLPCAAVTAWSALVQQGGLKAGDTLLVLGTGGVAVFGLQFAKLLGARVIVASSSDAKLERAKELGADERINYKATPDWDKAVKDLTGGAGADHVLELGGAATFNKSVRAVRVGGTISLIGNVTGGSTEVNLTPILIQNIRVQGVIVGSRETFEDMSRAVALHRLRPVVDRVFAFAEARAAFEHMSGRGHFGKIVVRM